MKRFKVSFSGRKGREIFINTGSDEINNEQIVELGAISLMKSGSRFSFEMPPFSILSPKGINFKPFLNELGQ